MVKRGFEFDHWAWVEADLKTPMRHVVTRVAQGVVYYKPIGTRKAKECTSIERFKEKLDIT